MPNILITGCNKGIGLELSKQYLADGWRVYATARRPDLADELNALQDSSDGLLSVHQLDVGDSLQRQQLANELVNIPLDILLNNAGIWGQMGSNFENTEEEKWLEGFRINTIAPMQMMQLFANNVARSRQKIIANMSSKMGSIDDNGSGSSYVYRSSKAALNMVSKSASIDLQPLGITVVILHPGWVRTDMGGPHGEINTQQSAENMRKILSNLTAEDAGTFFDIDGSTIAW